MGLSIDVGAQVESREDWADILADLALPAVADSGLVVLDEVQVQPLHAGKRIHPADARVPDIRYLLPHHIEYPLVAPDAIFITFAHEKSLLFIFFSTYK